MDFRHCLVFEREQNISGPEWASEIFCSFLMGGDGRSPYTEKFWVFEMCTGRPFCADENSRNLVQISHLVLIRMSVAGLCSHFVSF